MKNISENRAKIIFCLVLLCDFVYFLLNNLQFCENIFDFTEIFFEKLPFFFPLFAMIFVCAKIKTIKDRNHLILLRKILVLYFFIDILFGIISYIFWIPPFIRWLFYTDSLIFYAKIIILYEQFQFIPHILSAAGYLLAFAFLIFDISKKINFPHFTENEIEKNDAKSQKISASFKIAVANIVLTSIKISFDLFLFEIWGENKNDTGEHAIGVAFLGLLILAAKAISFIPITILSICGIVKSVGIKNKMLKYAEKGRFINILCLIIALFLWLLW